MVLEAQSGGRPTGYLPLNPGGREFLIYGTGIRNGLNPFACTANPVLIYGKPHFPMLAFRPALASNYLGLCPPLSWGQGGAKCAKQ